MIKGKIIGTLMGTALSIGTICYTYETFRFEDISHIYNNFNIVMEKYEFMKENRDNLLSKYNDLYNNSIEKINKLENELTKKEEYIKLLEGQVNEKNIVEEDKAQSDNLDNIDKSLDINEENN